MTDDQTPSAGSDQGSTGSSRAQIKGGFWRRLAQPSAVPLGLLAVLFIALGVILWGGFNWAMEMTNTESFCISCHEMADNLYAEYQGSVHDTNPSGVRATCPDCHVPKDWIHKVQRKIQATNELYHKALGTISTREKFEAKRLELAMNVWWSMKKTDSRECRNCHDFASMDIPRQGKRASEIHVSAKSKGKTCIDCHKGIAHELPAGAFEAEKELEQRWIAYQNGG